MQFFSWKDPQHGLLTDSNVYFLLSSEIVCKTSFKSCINYSIYCIYTRRDELKLNTIRLHNPEQHPCYN